MKIRVKTVGAGIFSLFTVGLQSILHLVPNIDEIDEIYFEIDNESYLPYGQNAGVWQMNVDNDTNNPFDFVLDQRPFDDCAIIHARPLPGHTDHTKLYGSEELNKYKALCKKIKIKASVLSKLNPLIDKNTLGVHVRLTDMERWHAQYNRRADGSVITSNDYNRSIDIIMQQEGLTKVFVASDNSQTIDLIKSQHPDIMTNEVCNRSSKENDPSYFDHYMSMMHKEEFWVDTFLEMLSLSKCGILLHKTSSLSNVALYFSDTLKKSYRP